MQSVSGLHSGTNPVSGDFSVGAEGLMVRDGALAEPVREVTIASTLQRMLLDVVEVGADLTWLPGGAAGVTLLVADMTMSGQLTAFSHTSCTLWRSERVRICRSRTGSFDRVLHALACMTCARTERSAAGLGRELARAARARAFRRRRSCGVR